MLYVVSNQMDMLFYENMRNDFVFVYSGTNEIMYN